MEQLSLFPDEETRPQVKRPKNNGGSGNPIVFHDYESFIAKFADNPKTTDDCYTPPDIYDVVVEWLSTKIDLTGKQILRPFYPGGDYVMAEYPEDGIVIDNPPFSLFAKIVKFYCARNVPFFLFGPGLTIGTCFRWCTAVIVSEPIRFSNGALVKCNFASNLFGDAVMYSSPELSKMIKKCPSQNQKVNLTKYSYPEELCAVSEMHTIAKGDYDFIIHRDECKIVKDLDHHPKASGLFAEHLLLSSGKAAAKAAAKVAAKAAAEAAAKVAAKAAAKAAAEAALPIALSDKEKRIISRLANHDNPENYPMPEGYNLDDFE